MSQIAKSVVGIIALVMGFFWHPVSTLSGIAGGTMLAIFCLCVCILAVGGEVPTTAGRQGGSQPGGLPILPPTGKGVRHTGGTYPSDNAHGDLQWAYELGEKNRQPHHS